MLDLLLFYVDYNWNSSKITVRKPEMIDGDAIIDTVISSSINGWNERIASFNSARTGYKVTKSF